MIELVRRHCSVKLAGLFLVLMAYVPSAYAATVTIEYIRGYPTAVAVDGLQVDGATYNVLFLHGDLSDYDAAFFPFLGDQAGAQSAIDALVVELNNSGAERVGQSGTINYNNDFYIPYETGACFSEPPPFDGDCRYYEDGTTVLHGDFLYNDDCNGFCWFDAGINAIFDGTLALFEFVSGDNLSPIANAGADFSVNEGQTDVMLDGSGSNDPDNDPLTYAWVQLTGTVVTLSNSSAQQPVFDAPLVAIGGETLTFELTVSANGVEVSDTVDITVVNVNHPPVADAGDDLSVAEGSPVTLHGEDSFDVDDDLFNYSWVQTDGSPTVTLSGADTPNPTFIAPVIDSGGDPGVIATLVFELTVDDGFPQDAPASGYTLPSDVDSVMVEITNVNNDPVADAGGDQTVDENTAVYLNGSNSSDPDSDPLTYMWSQTGGPTVIDLTGETTATPSFTAPFVSLGGADIEFNLTVDDGFGGITIDSVFVHVQNANDPPLVSAAKPTIDILWPPNHKLVSIGIIGISDPDENATIVIDAVTQDEPTNGQGDGDTAIDAIINPDGTLLLRAERTGGDNGRVYHIHFTASDFEASVSGIVTVSVPHKKTEIAYDDGELYNSTE